MTDGQKMVAIFLIIMVLYAYVTRFDSVDVALPRLWRRIKRILRISSKTNEVQRGQKH